MPDEHGHGDHAHAPEQHAGHGESHAGHAHGHDHHDGHGHGHGHAHVHAPKDFGKAFLIGIVLNGGFVVAEVVYGVLGNSLALLA
ncbi:MAG: cation transporter, partial [Pseudomonadota bacterium]|nr:cation transporter [Pseudomonadota bacterium]